MTPEGKIKAKVNKALARVKHTYKFMPVQAGFGMPSLDYLVCCGGRFVAIETKRKGKLPTERQWCTIISILDTGGFVFVVYDDDTCSEMEKILNLIASRNELYGPYLEEYRLQTINRTSARLNSWIEPAGKLVQPPAGHSPQRRAASRASTRLIGDKATQIARVKRTEPSPDVPV